MPPGKSSGRVWTRCSAKLAARLSYPQDVQNSICIDGVGYLLAMRPLLVSRPGASRTHRMVRGFMVPTAARMHDAPAPSGAGASLRFFGRCRSTCRVDHLDNPGRLGELPFLRRLFVDHPASPDHPVLASHSRRTRREHDAVLHILRARLQHVVRQTDGVLVVPSGSAELDPHRRVGAVTGHGGSPFCAGRYRNASMVATASGVSDVSDPVEREIMPDRCARLTTKRGGCYPIRVAP